MMMTIDPGDNTALAVWEEDKVVRTYFTKLTPKQKKLSLAVRQCLIVSQVKHFFTLEAMKIDPSDVPSLIIEGVSLWGNSQKSQAAALRGDSFRLAYIVGGIVEAFVSLFNDPEEVVVIDVRTWKGSLPTPILEKEVERFTGEFPDNEHLACAIGIGMNQLGLL
jgi:hypothetical protein